MTASALTRRLREETAAAHRQIEHLPLMKRLMTPDFTVQQYAQLLTRFGQAYRLLERDLLASPEAERIAYQPRGPLIAHALSLLPETSNAQQHAGACIPPLTSRWGSLYVLEGSILGGQIITRHLRQQFATLPDAAFSMFMPYPHPGQQWQRFLAILEQIVTAPLAQAEAITAAHQTYTVFQQCLGEALPFAGEQT